LPGRIPARTCKLRRDPGVFRDHGRNNQHGDMRDLSKGAAWHGVVPSVVLGNVRPELSLNPVSGYLSPSAERKGQSERRRRRIRPFPSILYYHVPIG